MLIPLDVERLDYDYSKTSIGGKGVGLLTLNKMSKKMFGRFFVPSAYALPVQYSSIETYGGEALTKELFYESVKKHDLNHLAKWAVRSSGPVSMPGMMQTKLNVPHGNLYDAVLEVHKSFHSEECAAYRAANGIYLSGTAVIIQKMVYQPKYSGVAFTADLTKGLSFDPLIEWVENAYGTALVDGTKKPYKAREQSQVNGLHTRLLPSLRMIHEENGPSDVEWCVSAWDGLVYMLQHRPMAIPKLSSINNEVVAGLGIAKGVSIGAPGKGYGILTDDTGGNMSNKILYLADSKPGNYPLLQKAAGFVTAAGGTTCHTAINCTKMGKVAISGVAKSHVQEFFGKEVLISSGGYIYLASEEDKSNVVSISVKKTKKKEPKIDTRDRVPFFGLFEAERYDRHHHGSLKLTETSENQFDASALLVRAYSTIANPCLDQSAKDAIIREIADIFCTYLYVVVNGEIRHFHARTKDFAGKDELVYRSRVELGVNVDANGARSSFSLKIPQPRNVWEAIRRIALIKKLFNNYEWVHDKGKCVFGGVAWGGIADVLLRYLKGTYDPLQFVDATFNLQHNNGTVFGKTIMIGASGTLGSLLNAKANHDGVYGQLLMTFQKYLEKVKWLDGPTVFPTAEMFHQNVHWKAEHAQDKRTRKPKAKVIEMKVGKPEAMLLSSSPVSYLSPELSLSITDVFNDTVGNNATAAAA